MAKTMVDCVADLFVPSRQLVKRSLFTHSIDRIAHQMGGVSFEVERLKFCLCMSHSRTEVMRPDDSVQIQLAFNDKGVMEVFRRHIMSDIKVLDSVV